MAKLEYSDSAKRVISKFYGVDVIVYVEGDSDIVFWEFLFESFLGCKIYIKPVNGKENLRGYIQSIVSGEILDLVAGDADFSVFDKEDEHPNIVKTYGYSIENSLVSPEVLREVIRSIGKISSHDISHEECVEWVDEFFNSVHDLVVYDILNDIEGHGEIVVGDHCAGLMRSKTSVHVCKRKLAAHMDSLSFTAGDEKKEEILRYLGDLGYNTSNLVKGHFLFSAALRYTAVTISEKRKRVSISTDSFMGALVMAFKKLFDERHPEYAYYKSIISGVQVPV